MARASREPPDRVGTPRTGTSYFDIAEECDPNSTNDDVPDLCSVCESNPVFPHADVRIAHFSLCAECGVLGMLIHHKPTITYD